MLEFLFWVYFLSAVIVGPAIAHDLYIDWHNGKDIYILDLVSRFIATICPFFNTFLMITFIQEKAKGIVIFRGKKTDRE
jgi:hypothetical protein